MRKILATLCSALCMLSLTACGCDHQYDKGVVTRKPTCIAEGVKVYTCAKCDHIKKESVPCVDHTYVSKEIKAATFETVGERELTCSVCGASHTEEIPVKDKSVIVTVTEKKNYPKYAKAGRFSDTVRFQFKVENFYDEDVSGVQGILHIKDELGNELMPVRYNFTNDVIQAGSSIKVKDISISINEFIPEEQQVYDSKFTDLIFDYEVTAVVFAKDPPPSKKTTDEDAQIAVTVFQKLNIKPDISKGTLSHRTEFSVRVANHANIREMKEIYGTFTITDLFGEQICTSDCAFTGKVIKPGQSATYHHLGFDVNEFIDTQVRLYAEKYENLGFEYKVEKIVYADGTERTFE